MNLNDGDSEFVEINFKTARMNFITQTPPGTGPPKPKKLYNQTTVTFQKRYRKSEQITFWEMVEKKRKRSSFIQIIPKTNTNDWFAPGLTREEILSITKGSKISIRISNKRSVKRIGTNPDFKQEELIFYPVFHRLPNPDSVVISTRIICYRFKNREWEWYMNLCVEENYNTIPKIPKQQEYFFYPNVGCLYVKDPDTKKQYPANLSLGTILSKENDPIEMILPGFGCQLHPFDQCRWTIIHRDEQKDKLQSMCDSKIEELKELISPKIKKLIESNEFISEKLVAKLRGLKKSRDNGILSISYYLNLELPDNPLAMEIRDDILYWKSQNIKRRNAIFSIERRITRMRKQFFQNLAIEIAKSAHKIIVPDNRFRTQKSKRKMNPDVPRDVEKLINHRERIASPAMFYEILAAVCKRSNVEVEVYSEKDLDKYALMGYTTK
jgi:hypothetical protein